MGSFPVWYPGRNMSQPKTCWVKICGITRAEDARAAVELGADAIGLVCHPPSARHVTLGGMRRILAGMGGALDESESNPRRFDTYALFVNPRAADVGEVVDSGLVGALQFHGEESPAFCESFGLPYMKAIRLRDDDGPSSKIRDRIKEFASAQRILLDAYDASSHGGTGRSFRWEIAADLVAGGFDNIVVAGGLHGGNVAAAARQARPFGVDASSGLEAAPGIKDRDKLRDFLREAKNA